MKNDIQKGKTTAPAVDSAIKILKYLSRRTSNKCTLTELSTALNINKSTCLRILRLLKEQNMVSYDGQTKTYSLGLRLIMLGARAAEFSDYVRVATPYLNNLMRESNMTTMLLKPTAKDKVGNIATMDPPNNLVQINLRVGDWYKMTTVASGLCFMAYMMEDELGELLKESKGFSSSDFPKSINNIQELEQTLEMVRNIGYCVTYEQYSQKPLILTIAAPVFDFSGQPIMSIAIVDIYSANTQDENAFIEFYGQKVRGCSEMITQALGGKYPGNTLL